MAERISFNRTAATAPVPTRPGANPADDPVGRRSLGRRGRKTPLPSTGGDGPPRGDEHGITGEAKGQLRIAATRFLHDPRAVGSGTVFLLLALTSVLVGQFWKYSYSQVTGDFAKVSFKIAANGSLTAGKTLGGPSGKHPFGVDNVGHDMLAQVMQGTKADIETALIVAVLATLIGTLIGAVAGFFGGWVESALMRFTDLVLVVPLLVILIVLANRFKSSGVVTIALVIAVLSWTYLARLVRADFLSLRERDFVEAARAIGSPSRRIIVRHMLPNAIGPIIVNGTLTVANAIILESTLSFLGLGIQPPSVSLGLLIANGEDYATNEWWLFAFPAFFIVLMVLTVNYVGDGLREAFDARSQRVRA